MESKVGGDPYRYDPNAISYLPPDIDQKVGQKPSLDPYFSNQQKQI